jgi:hypothetical protein
MRLERSASDPAAGDRGRGARVPARPPAAELGGLLRSGEDRVGYLLRRQGFAIAGDLADAGSVEDLALVVAGLAINRAAGLPALYQPVTLLWAIGRGPP